MTTTDNILQQQLNSAMKLQCLDKHETLYTGKHDSRLLDVSYKCRMFVVMSVQITTHI